MSTSNGRKNRSDPFIVTRAAGCESTGWNHAVDVRMKQKVLSPRVQNAEETNLGTKMLGITGDFHERLGDSAEQQVVEFDFVLADECVQLMREAEHHMEVRGREKFPFSGRDPTLACLRLALGAVAISAAIEGVNAKIALDAFVAVSAHRCGAAIHDRAHHLDNLLPERDRS